MKVRLLKAIETNKLHNLDSTLNSNVIAENILNENLKVIVIDNLGEIIGCMFLENKINHYYMYNLIIEPKFQNKKYGGTLVKYALKHINVDVYLRVEKQNEIALHIYEKLGFIKEKMEELEINGIKKEVFLLKYDRKKELTDESYNVSR